VGELRGARRRALRAGTRIAGEGTWAGVDVGGRRKGFHVAVVDERRLIAGPVRLPEATDVAGWLASRRPRLVAVDSPVAPAPRGLRSREAERNLVLARVCGIRYTPDEAGLAENPAFYEWITHGLQLYRELGAAGLDTIECFPTASWTRWAGRRGNRTRASWTRAALAERDLQDVPSRLGQDDRDAIAAALTARAHARNETERFGEIIVPSLGSRTK
jgi:predicted nuclease with RNAse H fold